MPIDEVTVEVANPTDIRLKVTMELPLAQWRQVLKILEEADKSKYYGPLHEIMRGVANGIEAIERREGVKWRTSG
jgi:hypothetical protein